VQKSIDVDLALLDHYDRLLRRLEKKHGKGKAFTVVAHKLARAVSYMLKRATPCNRELFLQQ
jgi:hypothetical protein